MKKFQKNRKNLKLKIAHYRELEDAEQSYRGSVKRADRQNRKRSVITTTIYPNIIQKICWNGSFLTKTSQKKSVERDLLKELSNTKEGLRQHEIRWWP